MLNSAEYWMNMNLSERVNYMVGYSQGVDTGVDVADQYQGSIYETFLNSSSDYRKFLIKSSELLYKQEKNRIIDWKSMLLVACSKAEEAHSGTVENQINKLRKLLKPYYDHKKHKPGDYWLQISNSDRSKYLDGLIDGIKTGIHIFDDNHLKLKNLFEGLFNTGSEIGLVSEIVTQIYQNPVNRNINFQCLFPVAYLKFSGKRDEEIEEELKALRMDVEGKPVS